MNKFDYFKECIASSLAEHGVVFNNEQLNNIAEDITKGHDNIGQAFYTPENPDRFEIENLQKELKKEQSAIFCDECNGRGRIITQGPYHSSNSECYKCHGKGKVYK